MFKTESRFDTEAWLRAVAEQIGQPQYQVIGALIEAFNVLRAFGPDAFREMKWDEMLKRLAVAHNLRLGTPEEWRAYNVALGLEE